MGMDDRDDVGSWPVIHAYTRKDAIGDGVLVDVSEMAREAGFTHPVAVTRRVYDECVAVPPGVLGQDESGRLWDILVLLRYLCQTEGVGGIKHFSLHVQNDNTGSRRKTLKAVFHHGDEGEPVITVMFPSED